MTQEQQGAALPSPDPLKPLLLLVDDLPANLRLLAEVLRDDYRIKMTTQGAEALKLAADGLKPDLILLDVMMPDMNGIEVLQRLRENTRTRDIPVVIVSADATEHTQFAGLNDGADDYLVKPIMPLALLARVRNLLRRKQAEDALKQLNLELERRVAERTLALATALDQAEAGSRVKSEFISTMSHELRTPMTAIIGLTNLCLRSSLDAQKQRDYLQKVSKAAGSLLGLIEGVLDFSSIEAGKLEIQRIPFEIGSVIANLVEIFEPKAREKGLMFRSDAADDIPETLLGDPVRLGQVLSNLVNNAVKFSERGEVRVHIEVGDRTPQDVALCFSVRDTGIGMSEEQIAQLFQPLSQADGSNTRKYGGIGLGLSLSHLLVELMGGKIQVESTLDQGTQFTFTLRFRKADHPAATSSPVATAAGSTSSPGESLLDRDQAPLNRSADEAADVPIEQLQPLLDKARRQLEAYDSGIDATIRDLLRIQALPLTMSETLNTVGKLVAAYDYEAALVKLNTLLASAA